ncbi:unnamed protein product [Effrenium voratum]|uniref:Uncharacterized protein n=1 Tax=Effrenium voratum TaxID=2562239 RepID=A0AA36IFB1_9DINO|nr:unnamed protein product [Effrenium voratum]
MQAMAARIQKKERIRRQDTTPAEKRAIFSRTRAVLASIKMKRPLQERLEQNSALARWGKTEEVYGRAGRNWKKVQEFLSATKQVKQSHTVMQIWLQVHKENAQKRLEEALTDFLQGDALPEVELEEAVEIFKAVEEETTPGPEETVDIHAFAKQAAGMMENLAKMQKEQEMSCSERWKSSKRAWLCPPAARGG